MFDAQFETNIFSVIFLCFGIYRNGFLPREIGSPWGIRQYKDDWGDSFWGAGELRHRLRYDVFLLTRENFYPIVSLTIEPSTRSTETVTDTYGLCEHTFNTPTRGSLRRTPKWKRVDYLGQLHPKPWQDNKTVHWIFHQQEQNIAHRFQSWKCKVCDLGISR